MSPVAFSGSAATELLRRSPSVAKGLGHFVLAKEGANGRSHMTCLQDTLVALLPRAVISRSQAEGVEIGFLEVLESALIYYSVPMLGGPVFKKIMGRIGCKNFNVKDLTRPLDELGHLSKAQMNHLLPAKAGLILSALTLTGVGGEYVINYAKNLMTAHYFKKDKFSDIVNLSQGQIQTNQQSPVVEKSRRRVYQILGACAGLLGASLLMARFGHKLPKWAMDGPLKDGVKAFDFNFKNGAFGLTKNQMAAYMALSVPAYLDSSRDKLEKWESASRLAIVLPYLLCGQDWLETLIREKFPSITANAGNGRLKVNSLEELAREKVSETAKKMHVALPEKWDKLSNPQYKQVLDKAAQEFQTPLRSKITHVAIPLGIGVFGTGLGVGLLNQYWTKKRFQQQHVEGQQMAAQAAAPMPASGCLPIQAPGIPAPAPLPLAGMPSPFHRPMFQQSYAANAFPIKPTPQQPVFVS